MNFLKGWLICTYQCWKSLQSTTFFFSQTWFSFQSGQPKICHCHVLRLHLVIRTPIICSFVCLFFYFCYFLLEAPSIPFFTSSWLIHFLRTSHFLGLNADTLGCATKAVDQVFFQKSLRHQGERNLQRCHYTWISIFVFLSIFWENLW